MTVQTLGSHEGPYEFSFSCVGGDYLCSIPGHGGGRDGPRFANHPEQEAWMRRQPGMKEVWYCCWKAKNAEVLEALMERLS